MVMVKIAFHPEDIEILSKHVQDMRDEWNERLSYHTSRTNLTDADKRAIELRLRTLESAIKMVSLPLP